MAKLCSDTVPKSNNVLWFHERSSVVKSRKGQSTAFVQFDCFEEKLVNAAGGHMKPPPKMTVLIKHPIILGDKLPRYCLLR